MPSDHQDLNPPSLRTGDVEDAQSAVGELARARQALRHGTRWERRELVICGAALSVATFVGHAFPHTAYLWVVVIATGLAIIGVIVRSSRRVVSRSIARVSRLSVGTGTAVAMGALLLLEAVEPSRPSILAAFVSLAPAAPLLIGSLCLLRK